MVLVLLVKDCCSGGPLLSQPGACRKANDRMKVGVAGGCAALCSSVTSCLATWGRAGFLPCTWETRMH